MDVVICFREARTCTSKQLNLSRHTKKNEVSENQVVVVIRSTANIFFRGKIIGCEHIF